jgi:hypothetical protein
VGSGDKRRFGKRDVLLSENVSGQGHKTKVIEKNHGGWLSSPSPEGLVFLSDIKILPSDSIIFQDIAGISACHCPEPILW